MVFSCFKSMQAWDTNIIETAETTLFNSTPEGLIAGIQANITVYLHLQLHDNMNSTSLF